MSYVDLDGGNIYYGRHISLSPPPPNVTNMIDLTEESERGQLPAFDRGAGYVNYPIPDRKAPSREYLHRIVDHIDSLRGPVYIFCRGGHGRSGVVAAATLGKRYDICADEALNTVQREWETQRDLGSLRPKLRRLGSPQTNAQKQSVKNFLNGRPCSTSAPMRLSRSGSDVYVEDNRGHKILTLPFYTKGNKNKGLKTYRSLDVLSNFYTPRNGVVFTTDPNNIAVWPSTENIFQSLKFTGDATDDTEVQEELRRFISRCTPYEAFLVGGIGKKNLDGSATKVGKGPGGFAFKSDEKERMRQKINREYLGRIRCRTDWDDYRLIAMIRAVLCRISYNKDGQNLIPSAGNIRSVQNELVDPLFVTALLDRPNNALFVEHTYNDKIWADGGDGGTGTTGSNYLGKILTAVSILLQGRDCSSIPLLKKLIAV